MWNLRKRNAKLSLKHEKTCANSHRRETLPVRSLRKNIFAEIPYGAARHDSPECEILKLNLRMFSILIILWWLKQNKLYATLAQTWARNTLLAQ